MKLIIAGGRDCSLTLEDYTFLHALVKYEGVTEIVSGGAPGADQEGEIWAKQVGLKLTVMEANWKYGPMAGHARNGKMARYADALVAFPGGTGTDNMVRQAKENGIKVFDRRSRL